MKKKRQNKTKQIKRYKTKYEYVLPQDEQQLITDAIAHGHIDGIRDGINDKSSTDVETQARMKCEQLKMATKAEYVTNDFEYFTRVFASVYAKSYFEKQQRFKANNSLYKADLKAVHDAGGWQAAYQVYREHTGQLTEFLGRLMGVR